MSLSATPRPHIVIIGAGFGGLSVARALANAPVDITIIDKRNYHLFQPLLYQVATADLSPADVAWPIRGIFSGQKNVSVTLSQVRGIDRVNRKIHHESGTLGYDHLVIACGSSHSYFGKDEWAEFAPGLKRIVDATEIRRRVLMAFERAELSEDPAEQAREMTFVIVGGGATGVEMAGAISELAHVTLTNDFRRINPKTTRILLIEGGPRVLAAFPEDLSLKAEKSLARLGVELRTNVMVEEINEYGVRAGGQEIPAATKIWAAGVKVEHLADWLGVETDRVGRVAVGPDLTVPGHPEISVIGDAAKVPWAEGKDVPGIAPAAKQMGRYTGRRFAALARGVPAPAPFRYTHMGTLATIGRNSAIISMGRFKLSGFVAWIFWGAIHIYYLIGVKRPLFVALSWFSNYVFRSKGARLITGMQNLRLSRLQNAFARGRAEGSREG